MGIEEYIANLDPDIIQSFPGASPPGTEIGRVERPTGTYIYFEGTDGDGNKQIYYATESGLAFAREMQKKIWKQKKN